MGTHHDRYEAPSRSGVGHALPGGVPSLPQPHFRFLQNLIPGSRTQPLEFFDYRNTRFRLVRSAYTCNEFSRTPEDDAPKPGSWVKVPVFPPRPVIPPDRSQIFPIYLPFFQRDAPCCQ